MTGCAGAALHWRILTASAGPPADADRLQFLPKPTDGFQLEARCRKHPSIPKFCSTQSSWNQWRRTRFSCLETEFRYVAISPEIVPVRMEAEGLPVPGQLRLCFQSIPQFRGDAVLRNLAATPISD